jgi:hypothetical protein
MGLLARWWGRPRGPQLRDCVWTDAAACLRGLASRAQQDLDRGHAVLLLTRSAIDLSTLAQALAARAPRIADDGYATGDLLATLATPGALGLSHTDALRPGAARPGGSRAPLAVHVRGRDARRSADARLATLLEPFAPVHVVFHHALDDALLRAHTRQLAPLLQALGLRPDEPIESPVLTRALQRAQRD